MTVIFDLLGEPVRDGHGKRGRPAHQPDDKKRITVRLLLAIGRSNDEIARALGVTEKTLRKHYLPELKSREDARFQVEATILIKLYEEVDSGNVAAAKELGKKLEKALLADQDAARRAAAITKPPKLGKKEQAILDAASPNTETPMGRLMAQRGQLN